MNFKHLSIAAALFAGFSSFASIAAQADEYSSNQNLPQASTSSAVRAKAQSLPAQRVAALDEYQQNQNAARAEFSPVLRAQVQAEAIEARRLGLLAGGEAGAALPTVVQLEQVRQAGLRAVTTTVANK